MSAWPKINIYEGDMPTPLIPHYRAPVFADKPCLACQETYTPLNPKQMYCKDCAPQWIPGYEDLYKISRKGVVMSYHGRIKPLTPLPSDKGFRVKLCNPGGQRLYLVHRLLLMTFQPIETPDDFIALPANGDLSDLRVANWSWSHCAALDAAIVPVIRSTLMQNPSLYYRDLAKHYDVKTSVIEDIMKRRTRRDIK